MLLACDWHRPGHGPEHPFTAASSKPGRRSVAIRNEVELRAQDEAAWCGPGRGDQQIPLLLEQEGVACPCPSRRLPNPNRNDTPPDAAVKMGRARRSK